MVEILKKRLNELDKKDCRYDSTIIGIKRVLDYLNSV